MKNYYDISKEELVNEINKLNNIILKQKQEIENLKEELTNKRKKPGRKPYSKEIQFNAYMLHAQGKSYREISKILGISIGTISNIIKGGLYDEK